ncbi:MAG: Hint domain-containing protein [Pseudomonadota bacterium]
MASRTFDWDSVFAAGDAPSNASLGSLDVTFSTSDAPGGAPATQSVSVSSAELGASTQGHLRLAIDADQPGQGIIQTITFDETGFPLQKGVADLTFDLLDVDRSLWEDQVQIIAYDVNGSALDASAITLTPDGGASTQVSGDTALGLTESDANEATGNVTVEIEGNIGRVDIIFTAGPNLTQGTAAQDVGIGPLSFTQTVIFDDSDDADDGSIIGTDADEVIFGGTEADGGLMGGLNESGADTDGTTPDDDIDGGGGDDRIYGGAGADSILGGDGVDTIFGGDGANTLSGGDDRDIIFGGSEEETISGGEGGDSIFGGGGTDILNGNAGADRFGLSAVDAEGIGAINGGSETDTLEINFISNVTADLRGKSISNVEVLDIDAGANDVTVFFLDTDLTGFSSFFFDRSANSNGNSEVVDITMTDLDTLNLNRFGAGNFTSNDFVRVTGDEDGETITGTFINDAIAGNGGRDSLVGGQGDDTLEGGEQNDTLEGGTDDDLLDGGAGNDDIDGGANDDTIVGSLGGDAVAGGEGDDTYNGSALAGMRLAANDEGSGGLVKTFVGGGGGNDTVTGVETFIAGEDASETDRIILTTDVLSGDVPTAIQGLDDNAFGTFTPEGSSTATAFGPSETYQLSNILEGTSPGGSAPAIGPIGDFEITGGDESGQIGAISFENFETILFTVAADGIVSGLDTGETMELGYTDADGDMITTGDDSILGNDGGDTIDGDAGDDTIDAGEGADLVYVGAGDDSLIGGEGDDTLSLERFADVVNTVQLDIGRVQVAGQGTDDVEGFENVIGSGFTDQIVGDDGANMLDGRGGADAINGNGGADTLIGGAGLDAFLTEASNWAEAVSVDGEEGEDQLRVSVDQTSLDLTSLSITSVETLVIDEGADSDFSLELLAEQVTPNFTTVFTSEHDGFDRQLNILMDTETSLDLSGITFTGFDQSGDRVFILGDADNETIIGSAINDVIASGAGEDNLSGGDGDDVFGVFTGSATIDGGEDSDTYDAFFVDTLVVDVDDTGAGFSTKFFDADPNASDSFSSIETIVAGEAVAESDAIFLTTDVLATEVSTAIQGLDDTAVGGFIDPDGNMAEFGLPGGYLLSDILNGTVPSGTTLPAVGPIGTYEILSGDEDGQVGNIAFENFENITFTVVSAADGVVDGTDNGQLMELGFADAQGDEITSGNDSILGNGGNDIIRADEGNDTLRGGAGTDQLFGGMGNDVLDGGAGVRDLIRGNEGDDTIEASDGNDTIDGGGDTDTFDGTGVTTLSVLVGGTGNGTNFKQGTLEGQDRFISVEKFIAGEDVSEADVIDFATDVASSALPTAISGLDDTAFGTFTDTDGNVTSFGLNEAVQLSGLLSGSAGLGVAGDYQITGGDEGGQVGDISFENFETIFFTVVTTPDGVVDGLDTGEAMELGYTDVDGDEITSGNDSILGNGGADTIRGGAGNDTIEGGTEDDLIEGGEGADSLDGGEGNDTLSYESSSGPVVINLDTGAGGIFGDDGGDTFENFENVTGSALGDVLIGDETANVLSGLAGDDLLLGGPDADTLIGGDDADTFRANAREEFFGDRIDGGDGASMGEDDDTLDLSGLGPFRLTGISNDPDGNSRSGTVEFLDAATGNPVDSLNFTEIESIICFTPGTRIVTRDGEKPVETLRVGDRVLTRDDGFQEICWTGRRDLGAAALTNAPKLQPILIRKGSLGKDLPARDMWVSPNHRMLQMGASVELLFGETEVLVAAKHLTHRSGITTAGATSVSYIHIMFDRHQIVMADGAWTESFCPGDQAMAAMTRDQFNEVTELFPELATMSGREDYTIARRNLRAFEARALATDELV